MPFYPTSQADKALLKGEPEAVIARVFQRLYYDHTEPDKVVCLAQAHYGGLLVPKGLVPTLAVQEGLGIEGIDFPYHDVSGLDVEGIFAGFAARDPAFSYRDYQGKALRKLMQFQRGICAIPTGGGKTEVMIACALAVAGQAIYVTDKVDLLIQMRTRMLRRGIKAAEIGVARVTPAWWTKRIVLVSSQALTSLRKRHQERFRTLLGGAAMLCFDETHHMTGATWRAIADAAPTARMYGFTGTPFINSENPLEHVEDALLLSVLERVAFRVSTAYLRRQGYLAHPYVHYLHYPASGREGKSSHWPTIQQQCFVRHPHRNKVAVGILSELHRLGIKTLAFVSLLEHGRALLKLLYQAGIPAVMSSGDGTLTQVDEITGMLRTASGSTELVERLLAQGLNIVIGSTIYDEGVDIPALKAGVLLAGGKHPRRLMQRIGRNIRPVPGKANLCLIFDFQDKYHRVTERHYRQRQDAVIAEGYSLVGALPTMFTLARLLTSTENNDDG